MAWRRVLVWGDSINRLRNVGNEMTRDEAYVAAKMGHIIRRVGYPDKVYRAGKDYLECYKPSIGFHSRRKDLWNEAFIDGDYEIQSSRTRRLVREGR